MQIKTRRFYIHCLSILPQVLLAATLISLCLIGIAIAILTAYLGKPIVDDWGAIDSYSGDKWANSTIETLANTGRYGQAIASSIFYGAFGENVNVLLPLIALVFLTGGFLLVIHGVAKNIKSKIPNEFKIAVSLIATFLTLTVNLGLNPDTWATFQNYFWASGIVTYTLPMIILLWMIGFLIINRSNLSKSHLFYVGVLIYFLGLFNETQPATTISISVMAVILSFIPLQFDAKSVLVRYRPLFILSMAASTLSILTLLNSSGNKARRTLTTQSGEMGMFEAIYHKLDYSLSHYFYQLEDLILLMSFGLLIALGWRIYSKQNFKIHFRSAFFVSSLLILSSIIALIVSLSALVVGYGVDSQIYYRTYPIAQLLYASGWLMFFTLLFMSAFEKLTKPRRSMLAALSSTLLLTLVLVHIPTHLNKLTIQLDKVSDYRHQWEYQDALLKQHASSKSNETIFLEERSAGIGDVYGLSCQGGSLWLNDMIEDYYDVPEICSTEDL